MKSSIRRALCAAVAATALLALAPAGASAADKPTRVLYIVLDQLRPDAIERYDMRNVQRLMHGGVSFPNAYLGHMGSETIVSHNVMTSGLLPKHMGWADEVHRDTTNVLGGGANAIYVTGSLDQDQLHALIEAGGYPKLSDYLHRAFPGTKTAVVGQKGYAVATFGGTSTDIEVTFSGRDFDCDGDGDPNWRGPEGVNVPAYLSSPVCGRFYVNSSSDLDYGTATTPPAWMYPFDGNRYVPGNDPAHLGGDVWVADAARRIMAREPWSGLFLTFGAIDKAQHTWGSIDDVRPYPGGTSPVTHSHYIAKVADRQVGRVVGQLRRLGQLDETLIVLTTDHGGSPSRHFHGVNGPDRGNYNWYYGTAANDEYLDPSPSLQPLLDTGNVEFSYQDSAIRTWLKDRSLAAKREAAEVVSGMPSVIAAYYRTGDHYTLHQADRDEMTWLEFQWWRKHGQELVDTEAASYGPDVIGLLRNNASYGVAGDHGGHQRPVQRIPIAFWAQGLKAGSTPHAAMRSVDIMPTVLRAMGIQRTSPVDGVARRLPR